MKKILIIMVLPLFMGSCCAIFNDCPEEVQTIDGAKEVTALVLGKTFEEISSLSIEQSQLLDQSVSDAIDSCEQSLPPLGSSSCDCVEQSTEGAYPNLSPLTRRILIEYVTDVSYPTVTCDDITCIYCILAEIILEEACPTGECQGLFIEVLNDVILNYRLDPIIISPQTAELAINFSQNTPVLPKIYLVQDGIILGEFTVDNTNEFKYSLERFPTGDAFLRFSYPGNIALDFNRKIQFIN